MESEVWEKILEDTSEKIKWKFAIKDKERRIFAPKDGYFEELTKEETKLEIRGIFKTARPATVASLVDALLEDPDRRLDELLFLKSRERVVGFLNGVFDLNTGKRRSYNPHDFILDPLPYHLPDDGDPKIEKWFIDEILASWVGKETADWFCNLLAYCLFIYPNGEQKWFNFFGMGANGKSVCLKILEKTLGEKKVIGCNLQHINRFSTETYTGKWLVIGRDSGNFVNDNATALIKNYSGDERAVNEIKGGGSYDSPITGKLIVSTNSLIQSRDRSHGWFRRIIPVPFPNAFKEDPEFERSVLSKLPAIIRLLAHRAYLYKKNKTKLGACLPKAVSDLIQETRFLNDRTAGFWELYFHTYTEERHETREGHVSTALKRELDAAKVRSLDGLKMTEVYDVFKDWHKEEFGDMEIQPSLNSFGGPYGAFLQSEAGRFFSYQKTNAGRVVKIKPEHRAQFCQMPQLFEQEPEERVF